MPVLYSCYLLDHTWAKVYRSYIDHNVVLYQRIMTHYWHMIESIDSRPIVRSNLDSYSVGVKGTVLVRFTRSLR